MKTNCGNVTTQVSEPCLSNWCPDLFSTLVFFWNKYFKLLNSNCTSCYASCWLQCIFHFDILVDEVGVRVLQLLTAVAFCNTPVESIVSLRPPSLSDFGPNLDQFSFKHNTYFFFFSELFKWLILGLLDINI